MLITHLVKLLFLSLGIFNKVKKNSFDIHTSNGRKKKEQQHLFVYRIILIVHIYKACINTPHVYFDQLVHRREGSVIDVG